MFETVDEARIVLAEHFEPAMVDTLIRALIPAIVLAPTDRDAPLGGSRLGGTPDLPPGLAWPVPEPPADPQSIAERGNEDAGAAMRAHFALNPPYAFVAQIDLAEAAALGPVAADLPGEGRLLFFYEFAVGPWEPGTRPARVMWDREPREALAPRATPAGLVEAQLFELTGIQAGFAEQGMAMPETLPSAYGAPARAAELKLVYRLPDESSLEIATVPIDVGARFDLDEDETHLAEAYGEFREAHDSFDHDGWRRQQLLGSPMPEQNDPRRQAVVCTLFGKPHLTSEQHDEHGDMIGLCAREWRLLLQTDLSDWGQAEYGEGTVYFLIRRDDLAARRFERVVGVYQQT